MPGIPLKELLLSINELERTTRPDDTERIGLSERIDHVTKIQEDHEKRLRAIEEMLGLAGEE